MSTRSRSRSTLRSALRQRSSDQGSKLSKSNPASRSSSPGKPNRRVAKLNLYLSRSAKSTTDQLQHTLSAAHETPRNTSIKRWDGNRRMTVKWDSIRRDPELWFASGDCLIHFYERGHSRRGASLRVSYADIESSNCGPLLTRYYTNAVPVTPSSSSEFDTYTDAPDYFEDPAPPAKHELYIPAPTHLSREEALRYHLTTRNFFARIYEKPVVGDYLGDALIALHERMNQFRPNEDHNEDDILAYIDSQGYTDFRDCCDHALGVLQFAEKLELTELWTDAFVHCVGMWEELDTYAGFGHISRTSQALISRAHLEMDLRLERAGTSLGNFLEYDLSAAYLGIGREAHLHLERFRSFLHTFYISRHGYWPPTSGSRNSSSLPQAVNRSMYFEFRNLYEYLVDATSGVAIQDNKPVDGGICVYQNVVAFDKRNKYPHLPHPLPLVPKLPAQLNHRKTFGRLFGNRQAKQDRRIRAVDALSAATNPQNDEVMSCSLVREYLRFEKSWTMREDTRVPCADARKVRWILVYAILQTLISVTCAPKEVRDTEGVTYPLCCQIGGTPPWGTGHKRKVKPTLQPLRTSLRELILELGPDMDMSVISAKPSPLNVVPARTNSFTLPRKISISSNIFVRSPQPIRASSFEILKSQSYNDISPAVSNSSNPIQHGNVSPINHKNTSPVSDPTTPSTSGGAGSGGWSPNSSEDDMDHPSINGSDRSNYGDDEAEAVLQAPGNLVKPPIPVRKRPSESSFGLASWNPEVDQYIRS